MRDLTQLRTQWDQVSLGLGSVTESYNDSSLETYSKQDIVVGQKSIPQDLEPVVHLNIYWRMVRVDVVSITKCNEKKWLHDRKVEVVVLSDEYLYENDWTRGIKS